MTDNQITMIIVAMLNARYVAPAKDNEKTAKEITKIYKILKDKTYDEESEDEDMTMMPPPPIGSLPGPAWVK